jgi:hypothetical protein
MFQTKQLRFIVESPLDTTNNEVSFCTLFMLFLGLNKDQLGFAIVLAVVNIYLFMLPMAMRM